MEELTPENHDHDLKQLIDNVNEGSTQSELTTDEVLTDQEKELFPKTEMNVLNLPPRKEVHSQNNQKFHFKMSRPFVRFIFVCILLVVVLGFTFYFNPDIMNF